MAPADDVDGAAKASPLFAQVRRRGSTPQSRARCSPRGSRRRSRCRRRPEAAGSTSRRQKARGAEAAPSPARAASATSSARARARRSSAGRARRVRDAAASGCEAGPAVHRGARGAARVDPRRSSRASCGRTRRSGRTARSFPNEVFAKLAARGWLGLKYGPDGADWVADAVLSRGARRAAARAGWRPASARTSGSPRRRSRSSAPRTQKERWLAPAIRGEKIAALAITEPDAGSDVAAIRTRAERVDGGWVVNGAKTFITNGVRADFYVTAVRTTAGAGGHGGAVASWSSTAGEGVTRAAAREARLARVRHRA